MIEHNLDVIKTADWVIDLGPDLPPQLLPHFPPERNKRVGLAGDKVVAMGTPEEVAEVEGSWTGSYLRRGRWFDVAALYPSLAGQG